jgi:A/G-specific adenine glycosylase
MKAFPTVEALAKASLDEVNAVWAGLGYYRRAKLLHECAKAIVAGGKGIPSKASELLALPGLGRYTAGAIASVVFGEAVPIVDGNVVRVMTRFRAIGADAKSQTVQKLLWRLAETSVDPARPGDFNQALMELGATVCTKANPSCDSCPVSTQCLALKEEKMSYKAKPLFASTSSSKVSESANSASKGSNDDSTTDVEDLCSICTDLSATMTVTKYPVKGAKKAKKKMTSFVTVLRHRTKSQTEADCMYLVKKRPDGGLLAGFWEFPTLDLPMTQSEEDDEDDDEEEATEDKKSSPTTHGSVTVIDKEAVDANLRRSFNIDLGAHENVSRRSIGTYEHKFTHIDQTVLIERLEIVSEIRPEIPEDSKWVSRPELSSMAISKVTTVCLARAEQKEPLSPKAALKSKKTATPEKGQRSITSMFTKSPAKK